MTHSQLSKQQGRAQPYLQMAMALVVSLLHRVVIVRYRVLGRAFLRLVQTTLS